MGEILMKSFWILFKSSINSIEKFTILWHVSISKLILEEMGVFSISFILALYSFKLSNSKSKSFIILIYNYYAIKKLVIVNPFDF